MTDQANADELIAAIKAARLPKTLGIYHDLKYFLRDHGVSFEDSGTIAHYFEAALIDARFAADEDDKKKPPLKPPSKRRFVTGR